MLLKAYDKKWVTNFNDIYKILNKALGHLSVSIYHIGSTSIPNLAAKPIIDIDISISENTNFEDVKILLQQLGYYHNGNQGILDREVFKRVKSLNIFNKLNNIKHHLYVCTCTSKELKKHLLFRDYLRKNDADKMIYENLKYKIANAAKQNRKKYALLKENELGDFINDILNKANVIKLKGIV